MSKFPRNGASASSVSRRELLQYGAAGLVGVALGPLLQACGVNGDVDLTAPIDQNVRLDVQSAALGYQNMVFSNQAVEIEFGASVVQTFILNGQLQVAGGNVVNGEVFVTFPDGTSARIRVVNGATKVGYGTVILQRVGDRADVVRVNGLLVRTVALFDTIRQENNFTGIAPFSDRSRAVLALSVLANTPVFAQNVDVARGGAVTPLGGVHAAGTESWLCWSCGIAFTGGILTLGILGIGKLIAALGAAGGTVTRFGVTMNLEQLQHLRTLLTLTAAAISRAIYHWYVQHFWQVD
jgi:hypothetical protein